MSGPEVRGSRQTWDMGTKVLVGGSGGAPKWTAASQHRPGHPASGGDLPASNPNIVVGVDGSISSGEALHWAVEEATRRRLPLHVLSAWQSDYAAETVAALAASLEEDCRSIAESAATDARTASPALDVSTSTVHAQA